VGGGYTKSERSVDSGCGERKKAKKGGAKRSEAWETKKRAETGTVSVSREGTAKKERIGTCLGSRKAKPQLVTFTTTGKLGPGGSKKKTQKTTKKKKRERAQEKTIHPPHKKKRTTEQEKNKEKKQ